MARKELLDETLEKVAGGLFNWKPENGVMQYIHDDGSVTTHTIVDYDNAWNWSNKKHAANMPEDDILAGLIARGYIK